MVSQIFVKKTVIGTHVCSIVAWDPSTLQLHHWTGFEISQKILLNELSENLSKNFPLEHNTTFYVFLSHSKNCVHTFLRHVAMLCLRINALQCVKKDIIPLRFETKRFNLWLKIFQIWCEILEDKHISVSFFVWLWV